MCLLESLLLDGGLGDYGYVKNSNHVISGVDDGEDFKLLLVGDLRYHTGSAFICLGLRSIIDVEINRSHVYCS